MRKLVVAICLVTLSSACVRPGGVGGRSQIETFRQARANITDESLKDGSHAASQWDSRMNLSYTAVTDAGLVYLKRYEKLHKLDLGYTRITDRGLVALQDLPALNDLNLVGTSTSDAGLENLKGVRNLSILVLNGTQITDAGLAHLAAMPHLGDLYLRDTGVTEAGVAELRKARPGLNIFQ
jgi:internalin A